MVTDSPALLGAGVELALETWPRFLEATGWSPDEMVEYSFHQVGRAHHRAMLDALRLPAVRALEIYGDLGNIGSVGVPIAFARAVQAGRVKSGDAVGLLGIGSGLNCAMMGLRW